MFVIADHIPGESLDRQRLAEADEGLRREFFSQLIDILIELRSLEFSSTGSLRPASDHGLQSVLGPTMSMTATLLGLPPQPSFRSAREYMQNQFRLISRTLSSPVRDYTADDIKEEMFALHGTERVVNRVLDPQLESGPFILNHADLRAPNIIVDENLQIQGIIDWEFASTVPLQFFTPPSWITGYGAAGTDTAVSAEFRNVIEQKSQSNARCDRLRREWYPESETWDSSKHVNVAFCIAHVLRWPTELTEIFFDFLAEKPSERSIEDMISDFFTEHHELAQEVQRRAEHCRRYTEYLKKSGLYETEVDRLLAASQQLKEKWGWH